MNLRTNANHLTIVATALTLLFTQSSHANPVLTPGVWKNITPPNMTIGDVQSCEGHGLVIDPKNPSTIYWCNAPYNPGTYGGICKTTDGGSNWLFLGGDVADPTPYDRFTNRPNCPQHMRIDPNNSQHLYCVVGVRGNNGFWESTDGGNNWVKPQQFDSIVHTMASAGAGDLYDVAVDPTDFAHVLVTFHYNWEGSYGNNSGIFETTDGGTHWKVHDPIAGWGTGHAIKFLYDPAKNIGNNKMWLLMTQGNGYWRTTDAGATWTQVSTTDMTHGGGTAYYAKTGTLYVSGLTPKRSLDNGATWSPTGSSNGSWCIWGDGTTLYTSGSFGASPPMYTSPETNGSTWTPNTTLQYKDGPYEMAYDSVNGIMYSSQWTVGILALKVSTGATVQHVSVNKVSQNSGGINRIVAMTGKRSDSGYRTGLLQRTEIYDFKGRNVSKSRLGRQAVIVGGKY